MRKNCKTLKKKSIRRRSQGCGVPVFVNLPEGPEFGPLFFPAVPRLGEIIEGEWLERENEKDSTFQVSRVFHCKSCPILSDKPHIYLYLDRLEDYELPPFSTALLGAIDEQSLNRRR